VTAPLVLVPGTSGSVAHDFDFLAPMLARRREVIAVDLEPGDPVAQLAAAAPAGATILGYSLGAAVAAAYAAEHRVESLILVSGWLAPSAKLLAYAGLWSSIHDDAVLAEVARQSLYSAAGWESSRPAPVDARSRGLVGCLSASVDAAAITAPTLVVGAAGDEVVGRRQSRLLFGAIGTARYAEIASGHAIVHERPAELLALIDAFLAAPESQPAGSTLAASRP
jgi:pimeloyl-ACP methyl ester carboxylesterase